MEGCFLHGTYRDEKRRNSSDKVRKLGFRTLTCTKSEGLIFTTPKTPNSYREVLLPKSLVNALAELKRKDKMRKSMGTAYHSYNLVVSNVDGISIYLRNFA